LEPYSMEKLKRVDKPTTSISEGVLKIPDKSRITYISVFSFGKTNHTWTKVPDIIVIKMDIHSEMIYPIIYYKGQKSSLDKAHISGGQSGRRHNNSNKKVARYQADAN
jgi:hypothetical protein